MPSCLLQAHPKHRLVDFVRHYSSRSKAHTAKHKNKSQKVVVLSAPQKVTAYLPPPPHKTTIKTPKIAKTASKKPHPPRPPFLTLNHISIHLDGAS
jgi:microcystin-dependent protein